MSSNPPYHDDVNDSFSPPRKKGKDSEANSARSSTDSTSTTSLILERINRNDRHKELYDDPEEAKRLTATEHDDDEDDDEDDYDPDLERQRMRSQKPMENRVRRAVYIIGGLLVGGWLLALVVYLSGESYRTKGAPTDSPATGAVKVGSKLTMDQVQGGQWRAERKDVRWIDGERDGLFVVSPGRDGHIEVQDVKNESYSMVLLDKNVVHDRDVPIPVAKFWVAPDLKHLLVATEVQSNWRHSFTARYWIVNVETQQEEPLVPRNPEKRIQLAVWSPKGDAVAFVRENNLEIRELQEKALTTKVTTDGGKDLFYGIPDWVYEEEVFSGNKALWWSDDGKHLAYLRTNETHVPDYMLQYFISRPSGKDPKDGLENYPELQSIKYPKAGAPNPAVNLQFFDVEKKETFSVDIANDFEDDDRLITEVVWAGAKKVLIRETNRVSNLLKMSLVDVSERKGKIVREVDVKAIDGGWFEVSQNTKYVPADPKKGRSEDGYIDEVIVEGYNHLAYFTPLDSNEPKILTNGEWEVVNAPSAIELDNNLVYFLSTQKSSIERHLYSVKLDGTGLNPLTNTSSDGFYEASFSKKGGYALLTYAGPSIPYQKLIGMPSIDRSFSKELTKNERLTSLVSKYELPTLHYSTIEIDGFKLNILERRPTRFNPKRKYPVIFYMYNGPGSQLVTKEFKVDFQAYMAATLEYIVVTLDGRGTGFIGRKARAIVRDNLGYWESYDQIEAAKKWAKLPYVDETKIAIWGWSYGGFMTLKTLEQDAGNTFKYGMAVAPVTDWRFYDSIYTERYMDTPQHNEEGYNNATISKVEDLAKNTRFLFMHGTADDNVHIQNSLTLIDKLDLAGVENYDVHVYPDSDHSIYFHNANRMVYDRLEQWIIRAFNGEYEKLEDLKPIKPSAKVPEKR